MLCSLKRESGGESRRDKSLKISKDCQVDLRSEISAAAVLLNGASRKRPMTTAYAYRLNSVDSDSLYGSVILFHHAYIGVSYIEMSSKRVVFIKWCAFLLHFSIGVFI